MDTIILRSKKNSKTIATTLSILLVFGVLISQNMFMGKPIFAGEELTIASSAITAPILQSTILGKNLVEQLTVEQKIQKFNEDVNKKYKNILVLDVAQGVKHIKLTKTYKGKPVRINIIESNLELNPNLQLTPVTASKTLNHKAKISNMAQQNNSVVAINGTFFKPQTGVPLGTLMINKKIYTGPVYNRVAMGIFDNGYDMARIQLDASLKTRDEIIKIDNINQPRMLSTYLIVYTPEWGKFAPTSPQYGKQVAVSDNKVVGVSTSPLEIPENGFVIVGPAQKIEKLTVGKAVKLDISTIPNWKNVNHIISGGPYLVKNGQVHIDIAEQKFEAIGGRNPRTAIGYTEDNHLIIVTVDGREEASVGMTLSELANFMKSLGCYNAMNLDGGGSTVLYINGKVVNKPQVQGGIALSNALALNKIN